MIRYFLLSFLLLCVVIVALAGFRGDRSPRRPIEIFPDMDHQPRFDPQHPSAFFADGRAARKPVEGTVPMGYVLPKAYYSTGGDNNYATEQVGGFSGGVDYYNTGRFDDVYGDGFPVAVTPHLLERGQERFTITCAICHGATGAGNGIISQYGMGTIASLLQERIVTMPDGQIFNTITNGKNTMGAYGPQITVEDRWAIVAYLRALQRSQNARMADVPEDQRAQLTPPQQPAQPAGAPAPAPPAQ